MKRHQKGFGVVEIIIIVVVLVLIGLGIWYVWQANNKGTPTQQSSSTSSTGKALEIPEFGVKVNNPENRSFQTTARKICGAECDPDNTYMVRDENQEYYDRCGYAASISKAHLGSQQPGEYDKLIDGQWYYIGPGDHWQAPCDNEQSGDEAYQTALRQYLLDNLVKL